MPGSWKGLDAYRNVSRLGRKTKIPKKQQAILWSIFERLREKLSARGLITTSELFTKLAASIAKEKASPFDFAVVDEAQDLPVAHLPASLRSAGPARTAFSSPAILGSAFSSSPSPGWNSDSTSADALRNLTVNLPDIPSNRHFNLTDCSVPKFQISMATCRIEAARCPSLTGRSQRLRFSRTEQGEIDAVGKWISDRAKEGGRTNSEFSFALQHENSPRTCSHRKGGSPSKFWMRKSRELATTAISTMHLAKVWSSAQLW